MFTPSSGLVSTFLPFLLPPYFFFAERDLPKDRTVPLVCCAPYGVGRQGICALFGGNWFFVESAVRIVSFRWRRCRRFAGWRQTSPTMPSTARTAVCRRRTTVTLTGLVCDRFPCESDHVVHKCTCKLGDRNKIMTPLDGGQREREGGIRDDSGSRKKDIDLHLFC